MSIKNIRGEMLIRPTTILHKIPDKDNYADVYQMPQGPRCTNEIGDTIYIEGGMVPYHDHEHGYETFLADSYQVEIIINGKSTTMEKGDIVQILPNTHHYFRHPHENSIWREMFQDIQMYDGMMSREHMEEYCPEFISDPEFRARKRAKSGSFFREEMPVATPVSRYDIPELKPHDRPFATYDVIPGVTCNLKVPRWEMGGVKEIWEFIFKKGVELDWAIPHANWDLFVVMGGSVHVEADGAEFTAVERDIINIPCYCRHKFTILEEGTRLFGWNIQSHFLRIMEELKSTGIHQPEQLNNWDYVAEILRKNDCMLAGYKAD